MAKQHKAIQNQGKRTLSAAQVATNTSGTFGGASDTQSSTTGASFGDGKNAISVPPATPDNADFGKTPLTLGHIVAGWKIAVGVLVALAIGLLWLANLSNKVEQHGDDIKEVKVKIDKLGNDSATASVRLQKVDTQVGRLEDKMFQQATERSKK